MLFLVRYFSPWCPYCCVLRFRLRLRECFGVGAANLAALCSSGYIRLKEGSYPLSGYSTPLELQPSVFEQTTWNLCGILFAVVGGLTPLPPEQVRLISRLKRRTIASRITASSLLVIAFLSCFVFRVYCVLPSRQNPSDCVISPTYYPQSRQYKIDLAVV